MVKKNYTGGSLANTVVSWTESFETKAIEGGSTETTVYYYVNSQLIAKKDNSGTRTYFHNDHLGSTNVITNSGGSVVETTTYDPWGQVKSGGTQSKFLYTGQERDSETGLHYYNARYYSSSIRRFIQPDSIIQNVYNPQDLNRYSYVRNNPLRYTDPSGHAIVVSSSGIISSTLLSTPKPQPKPQTYQQFQQVIQPKPVTPQPQPKPAAPQPQQSQPSQPQQSSQPQGSGGGNTVVTDVVKATLNIVILDDINTLKNPNASGLEKGIAAVSIVGNFVPPAKAAKVAKVAKVYDFVSDTYRAGHFLKHGGKMGYKTEEEYLEGAKKLFQGGDGVDAILRPGDDAGLFYREATNEFGILGKNGTIRSYYPFDNGMADWQDQLMKHVK